MIYILLGNDNKKKNDYLKKLCRADLPIFTLSKEATKEELFDKAGSVSLFGFSPLVILEALIKEGGINLSEEEILILKNSKTIFVFVEEKLLAADLKKYNKYSIVEEFNVDIKKQPLKTNVFGIADSFSIKDKIGTWILYREAITQGVSPEEISGIIFWKIKTMLLSGTKFFKDDELKNISSELVSIYHLAHRGEYDFVIALEQFILSSLSKK